jgi:hypothetical protein
LKLYILINLDGSPEYLGPLEETEKQYRGEIQGQQCAVYSRRRWDKKTVVIRDFESLESALSYLSRNFPRSELTRIALEELV